MFITLFCLWYYQILFLGQAKKLYLQTFLKVCQYAVKNAIYEELTSDKFDDESDESDKENNIS